MMQQLSNAELLKRFEELDRERDLVMFELRDRNIDWQHLASYGLMAFATTAYRAKYNVELKVAFDAVRAFKKEVAE